MDIPRSLPINAKTAIEARYASGKVTWVGPEVMLTARLVLAVFFSSVVAGGFALQGHPQPWIAAAPWLPVYGTLIDLGCIGLLVVFTRREGIRLQDLIGFTRSKLSQDLLLSIGVFLLLMVAGAAGGLAASRLLYEAEPPGIFGPLPTWGVIYSVLIWPLIWGVTEQLTYMGYVLPRLEVLSKRTWLAVLITAVFWALQHIAMPLAWDWRFMLYRFLSTLPLVVAMPIYLRTRRLVPFILVHWLVNALSIYMSVLVPLFG